MIKRKRNYFLIILIILIVIPNSKIVIIDHNIDYNYDKLENISVEPVASTIPNQICLQSYTGLIDAETFFIHFSNSRSMIYWTLKTMFSASSNINAGTYHANILSLSCNNTIDARTGNYFIPPIGSSQYTKFEPYLEGFGTGLSSDVSVLMTLTGSATNYLMNNTAYNSISFFQESKAAGVQFYISDEVEANYVSGPSGFAHPFTSSYDIRIAVFYDFNLNLIIDSKYYNLNNIKIEVTDKNSTWHFVNSDNINLKHPQYKLKLYDTNINDLIYEDTIFKNFSFDRTISIPSFRITNNYREPINVTYTTDSVNKSVIVQPYQSQSRLNESSTIINYMINDLYGNILEINNASSDQITYTPPFYEQCQISYYDQNGNYIDFENFISTIGNVQIPRTFFAEKGANISITTNTLNNQPIKTTQHIVTQGTNFISIIIDSIIIVNNWNYQIKANLNNSYNFSVIVNPYSFEIQNYTIDSYSYTITDIYDNILETGYIDNTTNLITYNPPETSKTLINLFNYDGEILDIRYYNIYLNSTRVYQSVNDLKINSTYNIEIFDILNNSIYTGSHIINRSDNEISIIVNVFELKIMNLMVTNTTIIIDNYMSPFEINDISNPYELLIYQLSPANYNLTYENELGVIIKQEFELTSDKTILLQTLQKSLQISLFDESGFGVSIDNVRMYYDNQRTSGIIKTFDGVHNIKILDYFNTTLFDQDVDITQYTEFNIYLPIYTLIIVNNYSQQMRMVIEREGISFAVVDQIIPALSSYQFKFAANLDYIVSMIYLNGTYADNRTINLASNIQIESFGYYSLADITEIDNSFSPAEIGLIIAVVAGLGFISIQSLRKPKVYKSPLPIPRKRTLSNNPSVRGNRNFI